MDTSYTIDRPQKATLNTHKIGRLNNAFLYTTLLCVPISVMGKYEHTSGIQYGFQMYAHCNNSISILEDIYEGERMKLRQSLDAISKLPSNWDGYDAPVIGKKAIQNCKSLLGALPNNVILDIRLLPTEYGGVQVVYNDKIRSKKVSIDMGDDLMSFYVRESGKSPQFFSYLSYEKNNIELLLSKISDSIA